MIKEWYSELSYTPTNKDMLILNKDYKIKVDDKIICIQSGFCYDGASVPYYTRYIVPPFRPKYQPAIVVHDYYCDLGEYRKADKLFEYMLLKIENSFKTKIMIMCVKLYHKLKYNSPVTR